MIIELRTCSQCKIQKPLTEFNRNRVKGPEHRRPNCRMCEKEYKSQLLPYIRNKYSRIKSKYKTNKLDRHKIGLTKEEFVKEVLDQLVKFNYRCPMTGEVLLHQQGVEGELHSGANDKSLSVDRINPFEGYYKDNMMVCSWGWNHKKKDMNLEDMVKFSLLIKQLKPDLYEETEKKVIKHFHKLKEKQNEVE